jgi:two-component system, NtrC family, sensor kinase
VMVADDASIMLIEQGDLVLKWSHARGDALASRVTIALGERVAGRVALKRTPVLINGSVATNPLLSDLPADDRVKAAIVFPLQARGELLGVLSISRLSDARPFTAGDFDRAGVLAGLVSLAVDNEVLLNRLRSQVDSLERSKTTLARQERLAAIGFLAAGIVHEINNPVAYMLGNLQFLVGELERLQAEGGAVHPDLVNAARDACEGANRIREIASDMRRLARSQGDAGVPLDVNEVVRSAVRLAGAEVRGRARVQLELAGELTVVGHSGALMQVFLNLIVNATHAISMKNEGAGERSIRLSSRAEGASVVVEVSDTGTGITPENLARVFEPLFTTKPEGVGSGLGLALCRDIVTRHGGSIDVRSTFGEGTTFIVRLPRAGQAQASLDRPHVLVIDDDPRIAEAIRRMLADAYQVTSVCTGHEALAQIGGERAIDVVLCDVVIPDLNGVDLYDEIRRLAPALAARFIFVTGWTGDPLVRDLLASTGCPVVTKPFEGSALTRTIEGALRSVQSS